MLLLAGAFIALSSYAQAPAAPATDAGSAVSPRNSVITKAGFAPEYYDGFVCSIFVAIEVDRHTATILRLVDPQPHVYQLRYNNEWVDITDLVLISQNVRFEPTGSEGGILHLDFTYQYPGGEVKHFNLSIDSYPVSAQP